MNIYLYVIVAMCGSFLLSVALLLFYLRYKKNLLHQQFRIQNAELEHQKQLTQVIIHSQEQERKRIGKELHDDVGNSLASLRLYLDKYMYIAAQENREVREEYKKRISAIFQKLRMISHQLSVVEIELFGLREAMFILSEHIEQSGGFTITIDESAMKIPEDLSYDTSVIIYRVFQELLTNTIKHAQATSVDISFEYLEDAAELLIHYADNGVGISSKKKLHGLGFKNIESRLQVVNGRFDMDSKKAGFSIKLFIPHKMTVTEHTNQAVSA
ncbi:sensor histidine kinase [Taibaiella chishuiensis]|uniref:histidine kinase n=1 Tax=Taibaiella chishuiensis TaxID=1434707 RepID=A0A2P8D2I6_9BACT|nr:ATP-binding protein [Taibaiella chishuiensis]PSK91427.1 histidine kinase [Taibaiella chishuiensis]